MPITGSLTEENLQQLKIAIAAAEEKTSGEIRLYLEEECDADVMDRAAFIFEKLKMHKTELRNGVLLYVAFGHKKFAIIGDAGIHQKVGEEFWRTIKQKMVASFKEEKYVDGLTIAIQETGLALSKFFPPRENDINELPNDIVIG
ncbi:MAG: hypothetical protein RLZZ94_1691 [Bacteroidota bacterium]|jgi:uncharacterized membrane protein